jgi:hypothetical protein
MTISFKSTKDLLDLFQQSLESSGSEGNTALQHRNQLELIWFTIDEAMQMFPVNSHDLYHIPAYKLIFDFYLFRISTESSFWTPGHVQASTLRSRYVSLVFFLQIPKKLPVICRYEP